MVNVILKAKLIMVIYKVTVTHHAPYIRKGDLEAIDEITRVEEFSTRKAAKVFIEKQLSGKPNVYRSYHKGNDSSYCSYSTGKTWVHENTGDTHKEYYRFVLEKVTLNR